MEDSQNLKDKLIKTERIINIYSKKEESPLQEISINIPIDTLKTIVPPKEHDPLLYDGYILDDTQLSKLNNLIENKITPNHELYNYVLECVGVYDW